MKDIETGVVSALVILLMAGCGAGGRPSEDVLHETILSSLEKRVPVEIHAGAAEAMLRETLRFSLEKKVPGNVSKRLTDAVSCTGGVIEHLAILEVGEARKESNETYWPVKVRVSGSCSISVSGLFEDPQRKTFNEAGAEFRVWKDAYGDWDAAAIR